MEGNSLPAMGICDLQVFSISTKILQLRCKGMKKTKSVSSVYRRIDGPQTCFE